MSWFIGFTPSVLARWRQAIHNSSVQGGVVVSRHHSGADVDGIAAIVGIGLAPHAKPWPSPELSTGYSIFAMAQFF
jgi:hypothetical protein